MYLQSTLIDVSFLAALGEAFKRLFVFVKGLVGLQVAFCRKSFSAVLDSAAELLLLHVALQMSFEVALAHEVVVAVFHRAVVVVQGTLIFCTVET